MSRLTLYGVIMAGGRGRRLWPLSTDSRPKQFIEIDGESLLARTYDRIAPLISPEHVLVVTNRDKGQLVKEHLPELPERNIIEEPMGKNTAPCIGLSAVYSERVLGLDPSDSVMAVLPADHLVGKGAEFRRLLQSAGEVAFARDQLVTLGIDPTRPATGYGYIEAGDPLTGEGEAREVISFTEKPDPETAHEFLEAGNYYWNSGTFIWRTDRLLRGLKEHMSSTYRGLQRIKQGLGTAEEADLLEREYRKFSGTSIDYGLMEKARDRAVIPASVEWSDLGDWPSFEELLEGDGDGNSCQGKVICEESRDNIIFNQESKPVVSLGISDLVVVNTEEALLVMEKERAQEVKKLAKRFDQGGEDDT